jgi:hypothetical protein
MDVEPKRRGKVTAIFVNREFGNRYIISAIRRMIRIIIAASPWAFPMLLDIVSSGTELPTYAIFLCGSSFRPA